MEIPIPPICTVTDCDRKPTALGLCQLHYMRYRRHGDTSNLKEGYVRKVHNYQEAWDPKHILAKANGRVAVHRVVLFDKIGYGPHLCSIGNEHINWRYGLETDHIDNDVENNTPENVRAVCKSCNLARRAKPYQKAA